MLTSHRAQTTERGSQVLFHETTAPAHRTSFAGEITTWLRRWRGDSAAAEQLFATLYPRLRRLAARQLAREDRESMRASDLAQETLLPLLAQRRARFNDRGHFLVIATRLMRRILVDRVRCRRAEKRGGDPERVALADLSLLAPAQHPRLEALDEALTELESIDPLAVRVVELRYFSGLTLDETATALRVGRSSVVRSWRWARVWLEKKLR